MAIQLFVPHFRVDECLEEIRECLEKGWTGLGFKTNQFEEAWKAYTGLKHAHFLSSNTVGLHLAVELFKTKYGWADDDEVITTPLTFVSSNHAILYANMTPVFADVDDTLCLDPVSVEARITDKTRAIIFVGIGGNAGQYARVLKLCRERGIKVILDAAHMSGSRLEGKHVGHDADATVFSFQAVKNLPTADSGMICFGDAEDDARVRKMSWLGINKDTYARTASQGAYKWMYDVEEVGYKYHGNSIMAAIGLVQLKYLDNDNAYRRQLAHWYEELLSGHVKIRLIPITEGCESSRHLFQVRVKNRDELMLALNEHEVYPGVHYRDNTEYRMYESGKGQCPNAHAASNEILSLPMHMGVSRKDVELIADLIIRYAA
ncbi:DegT/DnrJ/EryC1/StrS family aminotransferase [Burkholderia vietnamiensis]|uniref:DegT/DnrJ/EryC1/StrS family aminotransferase n=1 Tax=Burkholderia vietnamiensis TaxID=60552 RepID=UPI00158A813B|nr:DegT/DnrJ/EryC1/StrS family aminotransferase [Burkholderia vietnamiensis]MBR8007557.1 DegT/DnrJ/EryC1/StrS family aminotransferase [Burkholderia vietnamiensis]MCA8452137.1 DegT/DnrJ/EryC1/StrS family aminotransferase [Burkholderia vietnamiensis]MDN7669722.1 DegT/DnrJ/EryC1/StrS family aminotransferase [Burkholderia vietnamiensis]HDR8954521.1 DegT/DnrJ/EryC1/StrS family aminotransferase [Burkholderia vietnamiensis]HDR9163880.1 DegT/DnrJ/EryC1/StrS family aminotransferase [Burkholderia vietna